MGFQTINATSREKELRAQATGQLIQVQYGDSDPEYERLLYEALTPLPEGEAKTGNYFRSFMAGLCNQYFRFLGVTFLARQNGFDQILDESVAWKDTFGTLMAMKTFETHSSIMWQKVTIFGQTIRTLLHLDCTQIKQRFSINI